MKILAIETSCDETAVSLLEIGGELNKPDIKILGNTLLSQARLHEQYGGVYPDLAKREHQKNLPIVLEETLKQAFPSPDDQERGWGEVDFIAVTAGPGLEPALWAGITFAENLGRKWGKPVVPANHMEGHIWSVLYNLKDNLELPALALLVSGGHTELVRVKDFGKYEIIGRTKDDAAGEAFDKAARMLGLSYPGGPKISALARDSRLRIKDLGIKLPRPMINSKDLNFSFSGLKTAMLYKIKKDGREDAEYKQDIARAFEDAVVEVLVEKTRRALEEIDVKTLIVAGGVAANKRLIEELENLIPQFPGVALRVPDKSLTTDNALMIGIAAYINIKSESSILEDSTIIKARGNLAFPYSREL